MGNVFRTLEGDLLWLCYLLWGLTAQSRTVSVHSYHTHALMHAHMHAQNGNSKGSLAWLVIFLCIAAEIEGHGHWPRIPLWREPQAGVHPTESWWCHRGACHSSWHYASTWSVLTYQDPEQKSVQHVLFLHLPFFPYVCMLYPPSVIMYITVVKCVMLLADDELQNTGKMKRKKNPF